MYIETQLANVISANTTDKDKKVLEAMELLLKLTQNITKSPELAKYRTIRSTIPKIQNTLFTDQLDGIAELVESLGFLKVDKELYVFQDDHMKVNSPAVVSVLLHLHSQPKRIVAQFCQASA